MPWSFLTQLRSPGLAHAIDLQPVSIQQAIRGTFAEQDGDAGHAVHHDISPLSQIQVCEAPDLLSIQEYLRPEPDGSSMVLCLQLQATLDSYALARAHSFIYMKYKFTAAG